MHSRYWTKTRLIEVAKEYSSLKKFMKEQKGAYIHATRNGLLDEVTQHMERLQMHHGYWSIEKCKEDNRRSIKQHIHRLAATEEAGNIGQPARTLTRIHADCGHRQQQD